VNREVTFFIYFMHQKYCLYFSDVNNVFYSYCSKISLLHLRTREGSGRPAALGQQKAAVAALKV
jgi:hypothetical protein